MITKFNCLSGIDDSIEFEKKANKLLISFKRDNEKEKTILLSEDNLFSLIGQLLRIQSEIRKEVENGK